MAVAVLEWKEPGLLAPHWRVVVAVADVAADVAVDELVVLTSSPGSGVVELSGWPSVPLPDSGATLRVERRRSTRRLRPGWRLRLCFPLYLRCLRCLRSARRSG